MVPVSDTTDATLHDQAAGIPTAGTDTGDAERRLLESASRAVVDSFSTLAFWSAIALPALYLPLLANGIETVDRLGLFLGLFGFHLLALVGGRRRHL